MAAPQLPKPPGPPPPPGQASPVPGLAPQRQKYFDTRRADVERSAVANQQQADDALSRRFAALGQQGSGAAIDAGIKAREAVMAQTDAARNELLGQEMQSQMQEAQMGQQESQFGRTLGEQGRMFDTEQGNKLRQLDMADQQMQLEKEAQWFNERMAEMQSGHQVDLDISRGQFQSPEAYEALLRRLVELGNAREAVRLGQKYIPPEQRAAAALAAQQAQQAQLVQTQVEPRWND